MAKFVIECPKCGNFAEARTGFFARKKIDCSCGNVINVKTDSLSSRECPHCHNVVVYDVRKGDQAKCPMCKKPINTAEDISKFDSFACKQCGVTLHVNKNEKTCVCPVCDFSNDVEEALYQKKIKNEGLASVIKYEGDNETLIWKHPIEDFNYGSQLIVHESQEAIFFRDGQALDLFGAGRYTLETQQLPLLEKVYKLAAETDKVFHSEVYYINTTTQLGIKWGTDSKINMFDPSSGLHVALGASGEFNIRVVDSRRLLLKVVGTTGGINQAELFGNGGKGYFRTMVMTNVKSYLAQAIKESGISVLEIDTRLMELSNVLRDKINTGLAEYGLMMPEFFISRVLTPDDDPNFKRMKEQYAQQYLEIREEEIKRKVAEAAAERKMVEARTEAQMKVIGAQGEAEAYRLQAEAEAAEMRMKGYTYQQETARQVGLEAMKNGLTGGEGGNGGGTNMLGDIAGLGIALGAMGGVVGMTKDAMQPLFNPNQPMNMTPNTDTWNCACGAANLTSKCCPECGAKRPSADTWDCACGAKGITSKFCPECGAKRPSADTWDCACGAKGITSKFCPECGAKRPVADTWDCACGAKGISGKFCPECGEKRGE